MIRGALLGPYAEAATRVGLDPRRMVEDAGLPLTAFDQPETPISAEGLVELLRNSAKLSGREDFGLLAADAFRFSMLGALGLLMRQQPTVADALRVYERFARLSPDTLSIRVEPAGDEVALFPALLGRAASGDPTAVDLVLGDALQVLRALLGPDWRPLRLWLTRRPPADPAAYTRRFGTVAFAREVSALFVAKADLATPIPGADPELAQELIRFIEANGLQLDASLATQVSGLIRELLPTGACTVERVALHLGVDRRTIHRRLALEGQSFTALVEGRRRELVRAQLGLPGRPLLAVAGALGFSSLSTFSRWYRNAFGGTARDDRGRGGRRIS